MKPSTNEESSVERIHGSSQGDCARCLRDDNRSGSWVRVQHLLLSGGTPDGTGSHGARVRSSEDEVPRDVDSRVLKALLHRAETQSARVVYLTQVGPSVSIPQHQVTLAEAEERAGAAWTEFADYARDGSTGPSAREILLRLRPKY